jgi:hypothetical protein
MLATKPNVLNMQIWYVRENLWLMTNQYDLSSSISICPMIANFIGYLIAQKELYNCTLFMHTKTQRLHILCSRLLFHLQEPKCCCARIGIINPLCNRKEFDREWQCATIGELVSNNKWILQWQVLLRASQSRVKAIHTYSQFTHIAQPSAPLRSSPCERFKKNLIQLCLYANMCFRINLIVQILDFGPLHCAILWASFFYNLTTANYQPPGQHPLETHYYDSVVDEPQLTSHCISPW